MLYEVITPFLLRLDHGNGAGPVLERGGRLPAVVFDPQVFQAQAGGEARGRVQGGPADGQGWDFSYNFV